MWFMKETNSSLNILHFFSVSVYVHMCMSGHRHPCVNICLGDGGQPWVSSSETVDLIRKPQGSPHLCFASTGIILMSAGDWTYALMPARQVYWWMNHLPRPLVVHVDTVVENLLTVHLWVFSELSILFHWSLCLFLFWSCHDHTSLMTASL